MPNDVAMNAAAPRRVAGTATGSVETPTRIWREDGEWRLALIVPSWVAKELVEQLKDHALVVAGDPGKIDIRSSAGVVIGLRREWVGGEVAE